MKKAKQIALLTKVNAPYQSYMDACSLSLAIKNGDIKLGQINSFFTEISVSSQREFADYFDISQSRLSEVAKDFSDWSGQKIEI